MKKIFKFLLKKISRIIFYLIPNEFKRDLHKDFKNGTKLELKSKLDEILLEETLKNFKEHFKKSLLFQTRKTWPIREYAIRTALLNDKDKEYYYLEFGVWKGKSANKFSQFVKKLYCFDSFEGLREDWHGKSLAKGSFNLNKKIPKLNSNVEPIIGWVEDTLEDFLKKENPKINFIHLDMDTYGPTKFTLEKVKPYLVKNAIIIFDELFNYHGWENGEYKALKEVFKDDEFIYKAFHITGYRAVIQIK